MDLEETSRRTFLCGLAHTAFVTVAVSAVPRTLRSRKDGKVDFACRYCRDTGLEICPKHPKKIQELEEGTLRCSEVIPCKRCGGTMRIPCTHCGQDPEFDLEEARRANVAWLEKMADIGTEMKAKNITYGESDHFILTYNIKSLSVGRKTYRSHEGMHLYLDRLEALYRDVIADLGAKDEDFLAKTRVMIWEREHELIRAAMKYCRQNSNTKSYLLGKAPIFTLYYNKGFLHEEFELHQAVVHNVVHCLLSNVWNGIWPGNIKGGWIDAGYAHHYELKYFKQYGGGVRNYCYREGDMTGRFKYGKWHSSVRKAVDRNEVPSFLELSSKNIDQLEPPDHMFAWSYVDYLLKEHPDRFGPLALKIKERKGIGEALRAALDVTPFAFESKWKAWVQEHYSLKEKKAPAVPNRRRN